MANHIAYHLSITKYNTVIVLCGAEHLIDIGQENSSLLHKSFLKLRENVYPYLYIADDVAQDVKNNARSKFSVLSSERNRIRQETERSLELTSASHISEDKLAESVHSRYLYNNSQTYSSRAGYYQPGLFPYQNSCRLNSASTSNSNLTESQESKKVRRV